MTKNFFNIIKIYLSLILFLTLFISIFFIPFYNNTNIPPTPSNDTQISKVISPTSGLCWPLPRLYKNKFPIWLQRCSNCRCNKLSRWNRFTSATRNKYYICNFRQGNVYRVYGKWRMYSCRSKWTIHSSISSHKSHLFSFTRRPCFTRTNYSSSWSQKCIWI